MSSPPLRLVRPRTLMPQDSHPPTSPKFMVHHTHSLPHYLAACAGGGFPGHAPSGFEVPCAAGARAERPGPGGRGGGARGVEYGVESMEMPIMGLFDVISSFGSV